MWGEGKWETSGWVVPALQEAGSPTYGVRLAGLSTALGSCSQVIWLLRPLPLFCPPEGPGILSALCQREPREAGCWDCPNASAVRIAPF